MAGGTILATLNWRWIFWLVLPLALTMLALGTALMHLRSQIRRSPLDIASVLISAVAFSGIVYGFSVIGAAARGGASASPWLPITVGAVALAALTFVCLLGGAAILLPLYLQSVLGAGPDTTGLAVLPGGLMMGLLGRPVGRLFDRVGARALVIPCSIAVASALWLFAAQGTDTALAVVIAIHILLMIGLGLLMTPLLTEALSALPDALYSHGSAIMGTLQQVAGAAGAAAVVTVAAVASSGTPGEPDAGGIRAGFIAAGAVGILSVIVALFVRRTSPPGHPGEEVARADRLTPEDPHGTEEPAPVGCS